MLKFIKHTMETIGGVEIFPIISFLIFFVFFILLFVWVANIGKKEIHFLSSMPLEEEKDPNNIKTFEK